MSKEEQEEELETTAEENTSEEAEQPEAESATEEEAAAESPEASEDSSEEGKKSEGSAIPGANLEVDIIVEEKTEASGSSDESDFSEYAEEYNESDSAGEKTSEEEDEEETELPEKIEDVDIDLAKGAEYLGTGKRKSAVARVRLLPGSGKVTVNSKDGADYFTRKGLLERLQEPLTVVGYEDRLDVFVNVYGGGISSQSSAVRHGIARALIEAQPNLRKQLKVRGFLTRDARVKERKKAGLKKARKRPQFSKR